MPALLASNFLVPNGTFIVEVIIFILVVLALGKWVVPPLNKRLEERQATIRAALTDAEEAKRRHEQAEADYRRTIEEARGEARRLIEEARRYAEHERSEAQGRAQQEYQRIIERADAEITASARRAGEEVRRQVGDLVLTVTEKVIGEQLDGNAQRALIDRTIADVERETSRTGVNA